MRRIVLVLAAIAGVACRRDPPPEITKEQAQKILQEIERRASRTRASAEKPRTESSSDPEALFEAPLSSGSLAPALVPAPVDVPWIVDEAVDLGRPAPASAMRFGVVLHSLDGSLSVARVSTLSRAQRAGRAPLARPTPPGGEFTYGRGSGFFRDYVYWISHGSLVRRHISPHGEIGPLELLAQDAHDGTRVGVPMPTPGLELSDIPATVAYIVRPAKEGAPLLAKLWVEGAPSEVVTSESDSAHSVALVHTNDGLWVVSVQARMAMTPVHVRRVRFSARKPFFGEDLVVWVGGGVQPLTEMTVLAGGPKDLWGFIPHERSIKEFGLAELDITMNPGMDTKTTWQLYPNGIDPSPVAATVACGEPLVLYAEPETAKPDSSQELVLRAVADSSGERWAKIAHARAFYEVSINGLDGGALLAWATNEATEATTIRCKPKPK
jgi:hypothetical protein